MILPNRRFLAFCAAAIVAFAMVTAGGCGGSSSNNFVSGGETEVMAANSVLAGVWRLDTSAANNFVSIDAGGRKDSLSVLDFIMHFQSVDVESSIGEMCYSTIVILSSDRMIFPVHLDGVQAATEIIMPGVWSVTGGNVTGDNVNYSMTLAGTESNPSLHILVNMKPAPNANVVISLNFKKAVTRSDMTNEEMNSMINGTWQSPLDGSGINGGFVFISSDSYALPDDGVSQERSDAPLLNGMREFDRIFANYIFEETDTASGTTIISSQVMSATLDASGDLVGRVQPIIQRDYENAKITPLFNGAYRIDITSSDGAILLVNEDNTTARLITATVQLDGKGGFSQMHTVQTLEKKPDPSESTFNLAEQIGSVWTAKNLAMGEISDPSASGFGQMIRFSYFSLSFPEDTVDIAKKSFTAKVLGEYHDTKPENVSSGSRIISLDIPVTYIERIGYNTWYADSGDDETEGDNKIIITALNQYVLVTAFLKVNGKEVSIVAVMSRDGDMEDVFFSGAWQSQSKDAKVHITRGADFNGDVALLKFGAKFSSVDIDAGTAYLSAVAVLSTDRMFIPVVFDNEEISVDMGSSVNEYVVTTRHGIFTVLRPSEDSSYVTLSGDIFYPEHILTVNINAKLRKMMLGLPGQPTVESRQYDFAQVMNGSTWQTHLYASQSGGFAITDNSAGLMMYPGIASKTFANIVFDGDSAGGTISGFGALGLMTMDPATRQFVDKGSIVPVTMIKQKVNVSNVFANYYRFEIASADQYIKGVFIIESETSARMIMFTAAENILSTGAARIYSMFTLHKVTETQAIDLAAFNNTSWKPEQVGGFLLLPRSAATPFMITNGEPDAYSASMSSTDVRFHSADLAARTVSFTLSEYVTIPARNLVNVDLLFSRQVEIERIGAYTWHAKTVGEDAEGSDFLMVMSAAAPNRAALAGNITFESRNRAGSYVHGSLLFDMVRKQ